MFEDTATALQLRAMVTVSLVYPLVAPEFALTLVSSGGSARAAPSDIANLRAMEREVNVHYDELISGNDGDDSSASPRRRLLLLQMRRLQVCCAYVKWP